MTDQQVAVLTKRQHAWTQSTCGTYTPARTLPFFLTASPGQIKGFTLLKPKGIYGLRQSTAQLWSESNSTHCGCREHKTEETGAITAAFPKADTKQECSCSHHIMRFREKKQCNHTHFSMCLMNLEKQSPFGSLILIPYQGSSHSACTWCCTAEHRTSTYYNTNYKRNGTTWF